MMVTLEPRARLYDLVMEAAAACMDPHQHTLFEAIGKQDPDVYIRLYRGILKRAYLLTGAEHADHIAS